MSQTLLNERQAAQRLNVSVKTLQAQRFNHRGPAFLKLGRSIRYDPKDLEAYISENRISTTQEAANA